MREARHAGNDRNMRRGNCDMTQAVNPKKARLAEPHLHGVMDMTDQREREQQGGHRNEINVPRH